MLLLNSPFPPHIVSISNIYFTLNRPTILLLEDTFYIRVKKHMMLCESEREKLCMCIYMCLYVYALYELIRKKKEY